MQNGSLIEYGSGRVLIGSQVADRQRIHTDPSLYLKTDTDRLECAGRIDPRLLCPRQIGTFVSDSTISSVRYDHLGVA